MLAVFITAFLPDCTNPRPHTIDKVTLTDWMDSVTDAEHVPVPPSVFLGPQFLRHKLYELSPPEEYTLSQVADLRSLPPFSEARYGAVSKVYIVCKQDRPCWRANDDRQLPGSGDTDTDADISINGCRLLRTGYVMNRI
ncbi:hypothetical protein BS78_03G164400 [Paspalum vaginatum]|nr:hypothetical protein BS78_03G164400 [Paspalum vaginatum]